MNQEQTQQPAPQPQEQDHMTQYMVDTLAKIQALTQKMDTFGRLVIQAIMELEAAIEDRSGQKIEGLQSELSKVQEQLSAIIEE